MLPPITTLITSGCGGDKEPFGDPHDCAGCISCSTEHFGRCPALPVARPVFRPGHSINGSRFCVGVSA